MTTKVRIVNFFFIFSQTWTQQPLLHISDYLLPLYIFPFDNNMHYLSVHPLSCILDADVQQVWNDSNKKSNFFFVLNLNCIKRRNLRNL